VSQQPEDSTASAQNPTGSTGPNGGARRDGDGRYGDGRAEVSVRRAPRYYRFMLVGLVVGVLVSLVLTFSFPAQDDFSQLQVFGFIGIFLVAICVALGALLAIVLDRASRRRARTVAAEHEEHEAPAEGPARGEVEFVQVRDEEHRGGDRS
jgi:uncharacterized membrane protein YbhN (UPF0104 family)